MVARERLRSGGPQRFPDRKRRRCLWRPL